MRLHWRTRIDDYDDINGDGEVTGMTLAGGATINVDADEVSVICLLMKETD